MSSSRSAIARSQPGCGRQAHELTVRQLAGRFGALTDGVAGKRTAVREMCDCRVRNDSTGENSANSAFVLAVAREYLGAVLRTEVVLIIDEYGEKRR